MSRYFGPAGGAGRPFAYWSGEGGAAARCAKAI
jgi:hypothetical protein